MKKEHASGQGGLHLVPQHSADVPFEIEEAVAETQWSDADVSAAAAPDDAGGQPAGAGAGVAAPAAPEAADVPLAETAGAAAAGRPRSVWRKLSTEDLPQVSLREFLGGDYLVASFLRRNIGFVVLLLVLGIFYISNRYAAQQEIIEEEMLRKELTEKKNYALTQYAQLTMYTRQSNLEQRLYALGDSTLLPPTEPPFVITRK